MINGFNGFWPSSEIVAQNIEKYHLKPNFC